MDKDIKRFCQKWNISEFAFFGSVNTEKFNSDSDIDILLSFKNNASIGFFELSDIKDELEKLLGRDVDIITKRGLEKSKNPVRKKSILNSSKIIFSEEG